ncbi:MAG: hypothetical protein LBP22_04495 [Deltaproteobacteria bacterium]|nr:hypothetical protein [Deltaproteobacteria bacterium]
MPDLGTHSLRKTFGRHMYQKSGRNAGMIQKMLNHSRSCAAFKIYWGRKGRN